MIAFPAMKIASDNGVPKAANTAFLGCMSALGLIGLPEEHILEALAESFASKPHWWRRTRRCSRRPRRGWHRI